LARETLVRRRCARVLHSFNAIPITEVRSEQQASERPHGVQRVTWGERMERSKEQERRADHVQPSGQDLAGEVLSAVHARV
jgi:hypothetical protein